MMMSLTEDNIAPRRFAAILLLVMVVPVVLIIGHNLVLDPFQLFFADREDPIFLSTRGKDRYQHPAVVHHYQPRSIVVGHSLAANFPPTVIERQMGWRNTYNLTLQGSTIYEHRRVARLALENAPVEEVLWLFFPANLRLPAKVHTPKVTFPEYLYDESRGNDLKFFATLPWNVTPYVEEKAELRQQIADLNRRSGKRFDPRDLATNWHFLQENRFNDPEAVASEILGKYARKPQAYSDALAGTFGHLMPPDIDGLTVDPAANFFDNLDSNLRSVVADYPRVSFTVVPMPPLTLLHWQHLRITEPETYRSYLLYVRDTVQALSAYPNVKLFLFGNLSVARDMRLYRDHGHYHMAVNELMLELLARGEGQVNADNVADYLSHFDRVVLDYRADQYRPVMPPDPAALSRGELSLEQAREIVARLRDRN